MTLRLNNPVANPEHTLLQSLWTESITMHGLDFFYIPRKYVAKNEVLGEDRLSRFEHAYPIVMYMDNAESGFQGQGSFASKFGLMIEQQASLMASKQTWDILHAAYPLYTPTRPTEGDLIYFPMTKSLLEIMFVDHQSPFYQLTKQFTYKLTVETFRYSSETIATSVTEVDAFNTLLNTASGVVAVETPMSYGDNTKLQTDANAFVWNTNDPFGTLK